MPKQHFVKYPTFDYSILGEVCEQAPVSFHFLSFSFIFFSFLFSQTHFEDVFLEDERLKPLPP